MGPSATQMLADLGADVIKVEPPGGDMLRATGPGGRAGAGPLFLNLNRNKRSIVLDLKRPEGKEAALKLAQSADALVYNVRPQAMKRLGLDYEAVRQLNPRIVYVGTFGFSQRGRYAALRAFDDLIQAAVAIPEASLRAGSDVPRYAPLNLSDRATGLYAFGVICAALLARERTGRGQSVDVPMFETTAQMMLGRIISTVTTSSAGAVASAIRDAQPAAAAVRHPGRPRVPGRLHRRAWKAFCARVARPSGFAERPRFATANRARSISRRCTRSWPASSRQDHGRMAQAAGAAWHPVMPATPSSRCWPILTCRTSGSSSNSRSHRGRASNDGGAQRMAANAAAAARPPPAGRAQRANCWPRRAIRASRFNDGSGGVTEVTTPPSEMEVAA